jgi:hypothetical protein
MEQIAAAGNTEVPAYLALRQAGFEVTVTPRGGESEQWVAKKTDVALIAESPLELLGLWAMRKERGSSWKASGEEIEAFLKQFYPQQG